MPVDVFISHSSQDKHVADAVCATLESRGIRCWIAPRDILPGEEWAEAILNAIQNSQLMLLVFSAHANESPQVRKEVERAVHHAIPIIPVRIQDVLPNKSLEYFISTPHWLDAMTPPLEKHLDHVAGTVTLVLKRQRGEAVSDSETRAVTIADDIAPRESRPNSMMTISTGAVVLTAAAALLLVAGLAVTLIWLGGRHPAKTDQIASAPPLATQISPPPPALPTPAQGHLAKGDAALGRYDFDGAIDEYTKAIAIEPGNGPAYIGRAFARAWKSQEDQFAGAADDGAKAIEINPSSAAAHAAYGLALLELRQTEKETNEFNEALRLDSNCLMAHIGRAIQFSIDEDFDSAKTEADSAKKIDPRSPMAWVAEALVYNYESDWSHSMEACGQAILLAPDWWYPHGIRAVAKAGLGQIDEGRAEAEKAVRLAPNAGFAYQARGYVELTDNDLDSALADADKVIALRPQYPDGYALRATVLAFKSKPDLDGALDAAAKALDRDPRNAVQGIRGWVYLQRSLVSDALKDTSAAIRNHPNESFLHYLRGMVYEKRREFDKALRDYTEGIRLNPNNALCYQMRGRLLIDQGQGAPGMADIDTAIKIHPDVQTLVYRSLCYNASKMYDKQMADAQAALAISPDDASALASLGIAELRLNQIDEAIRDLTTAIAHDPNQPSYYTARGQAYTAKGLTSQAASDESMARMLNTPRPTAPTTRRHLPTTNPDGLAIRYVLNDKGQPTEARFFSATGTPAASRADLGAFCVKSTYDSAGRLDTITSCDADGNPINNTSGFSMIQYTYDSANQWISHYYDVQHRPMTTYLVVIGVDRDSAAMAAGLQLGDVISTYNGYHVASMPQLQALEKLPIPDPRVLTVYRSGQVVNISVHPGPLGFRGQIHATLVASPVSRPATIPS